VNRVWVRFPQAVFFLVGLGMKGSVSYRDQIWRYQVRQWRQDGPDRIVAIVTDGCTDSISVAFALLVVISPRRFLTALLLCLKTV
jgi:hypothetical protein